MAAGPQKLRVFISSTVYDLIDVRSEISAHLTAMGVTPVLSDDKLSDFHVQQDENSIETCLTKVESCDELILILDQRYGPKLGRAGFDDVSATHLEYRHAVESKRPIHVFVRDRLAAEFSIWKNNKQPDSMKLAWIKDGDFGLFRLLNERAELSAEREGSNWYSTFTSSIDLKAALEKQFRPQLLPGKLADAIQNNRFPLIGADLEATSEQPVLARSPRLVTYRVVLTNVGGGPAFNCRYHLAEEPEIRSDAGLVAPGQSIALDFTSFLSEILSRTLVVEYESLLGILVRDRFNVFGERDDAGLHTGAVLESREFFRCPELNLRIQDSIEQEPDGQHLQAD